MNLRKAAFALPNMFTLASLFCGFYAIASSFRATGMDDLYRSSILILFAAVFDAFDGRIARLTKTQSALGQELDSLADVVAFGVAPAALVYNWGLHKLGFFGMLVSFAWIACGAIRLARFNVLAWRAPDGKPGKYIVGLPIPAAASVVVAVLVAIRSLGGDVDTLTSGVLAAIVAFLSFLMVSRVHFRSFKAVSWKRRRTFVTIAAVLVVSVALWIGLAGAVVLLFLVLLYVGLGLAEALITRPHRTPPAPPHV
jgi:CDP-diacylglycerol---serine O-phosphatidyltransferase